VKVTVTFFRAQNSSPQPRQHHHEGLKEQLHIQNCIGIVINAKENQEKPNSKYIDFLKRVEYRFLKNNSSSQASRVIHTIVVGMLLVSRWLNFEYSVKASNGQFCLEIGGTEKKFVY
jgi:hypothetical protein